MQIQDLITLLSTATEGSDYLDRAIRDTLALPTMLVPPDGGDEAPPYTTSIDVAVTLVPLSWAWSIGHVPGANEGHAAVWLSPWHSRNLEKEHFAMRRAATPVLALCICAISAHAALQ